MNTRSRRRVGAGVWGVGLLAALGWGAMSTRSTTAIGYAWAPTVAVSPLETARVAAVPKGLHDPVGADEVVVRLDPGALTAERELAEANFKAVQQEQQLASVNWARRFAQGVDTNLVEKARLQVGLSEDQATLDALRDRLAVEEQLASTGASSTQAVEEWRRQIHVLEAKVGANEAAISTASTAASGAQARRGDLPSSNEWAVVAAGRALDTIDARIAAYALKAGVDGEVIWIDHQPGDVAVAGMPVVQVRPRTTRDVVAFVDPGQAPRLAPGAPATVRRATGPALVGEVVSVGSGPVALPTRLWPAPNDPTWGVTVRVRVGEDLRPDENVTVRL